jgi:hypothetical protein
MAVLTTYNTTGRREDLADIIYNISPSDTPFMSGVGKNKATNTTHSWQTDTLTAVAANAKAEGATISYPTLTSSTKVSNYTQISSKACLVSGTDDASNLAGRNTELAYQVAKSAKELEKFKNEYPDVYEVVESVAHMQSENQVAELQTRLDAMQGRETEILKREAEKDLREKHPDFDEIRNSDEFQDWANLQPESIKDWIFNNPSDATLASRALDLFKKDIGLDVQQGTQPKSNSKQTKQSAADMISTKTTSVKPNQQRVWSEREITAMSVAEFDKYESEISDAMQEGRIIK